MCNYVSVYFCYSCTGWSISNVACTHCGSTNIKEREKVTMSTTTTAIPKKVVKKIRKIVKDEDVADKLLSFLLSVWPESITTEDAPFEADTSSDDDSDTDTKKNKKKDKKKKKGKKKGKKSGELDEFPSNEYSKGDLVLVKFETGRPKKCEIIAHSNKSGNYKVLAKASGEECVISPDQITGTPK